ncbi:MAG: D-allose transport system permease protein AlsC [Firmicutes bacterium ADurb.Bin153]|nr:MAG: D-allose transport system permease protein AlsC [Firmicutes bacterium ADurb.Bin153]
MKSIKKIFPVLILLALPLFAKTDYQMYVLSLGAISSILVISLNYLMGLCGLTSLGHAAFWGLGAYTTALLLTRLNFPFIVALLMGGIVSAMVGVLLGIPSLKIKNVYLVITTIGFNQILELIFNNWVPLTRGADGIPQIPPPSLGPIIFSTPIAKYYFIVSVMLISVLAFARIKDSRVGRAVQAIRDNEMAAESSGIDVRFYKILIFTISAFVAGISGGLLASFIGYISPDTFSPAASQTIVAMLLVGGPGTIWGAVVGGFMLQIIPEWMRFLKESYMALYGLLVAIIALKAPGGIGELVRTLTVDVLMRLKLLRTARKAEDTNV